MLKLLRLIRRGILILINIALIATVLLLGQVVQKFSERTGRRICIAAMQLWARNMAWITGIHITHRGPPPRPPFLLVSNHLSYIDIIIYYTRLKTVFVAKQEVRAWPVMGFLIFMAETIFINRASRRDIPRVNQRIEDNITAEHGVVFFPEGTSSMGAAVLPFKPSLLDIPANRKMPVHYAVISYRTSDDDPPAHLSVCWWGDMPFFQHLIKALTLKRIDATITFGEQTLTESNRKVLAEALWHRVSQSFTPVVVKEAS